MAGDGARESETTTGEQLTVLAVDDEENILRSLKRLLHRQGYRVLLASGGEAALEVLREEEVAVLICDQRMPGMSGAEVLEQARKIRPDTYRITLTGYTDMSAAQDSINLGAVNQFLTKPWEDARLLEAVERGATIFRRMIEHRRLQELTRVQKEELERLNKDLEEQVRQRTEKLARQNERLKSLGDQIEGSLRDTVVVLASLLEAWSPNLAIHSKRVAVLALTIARRAGVRGRELRDVEFAARLHDIGLVAELYDRHRAGRSRQAGPTSPEIGARILSGVAGFEGVAAAVGGQRERYDGKGEPRGLSGEQIPLGARLIAVADAYDEAVYSEKFPMVVARREGRRALVEGRGSRFDPHLVDLLIAHIDEEGIAPEGDREVELSPWKLEEGMVIAHPIQDEGGVLMLQANTRLTESMIERIQHLSLGNALFASVMVQASEEPGGPATPPPPAPPPRARPEPAASPPPPPPQQEPGRAEARPRRVLVVDDVALVCNALKRRLRIADYEVVTVSRGKRALELVAEQPFALVITDYAMPEMNGEQLIEELREVDPDLPCILLTGNAPAEVLRGLEAYPNVVAVVAKPWNNAELMGLINRSVLW